MEFRNPVYNSDNITIDCLINHPIYGWIPFTANPDDPEEHGRIIYSQVLASGPAPYVEPVLVINKEDVDVERNRRLNTTFTFMSKEYDCDEVSLSRITGAATLAGFAIGSGAKVGDLRWHGGFEDFVWISADNSLTPMDAPTCFSFGQAAASNQSSHVFAARNLKDSTPIPIDYMDDRYWP